MEIRQYENGVPILGTAITIPDEVLPPGVTPDQVSYAPMMGGPGPMSTPNVNVSHFSDTDMRMMNNGLSMNQMNQFMDSPVNQINQFIDNPF